MTELVEDAPVLVGRPSDEELRRIIEEPGVQPASGSNRHSWRRCSREYGDADGALPLVSTRWPSCGNGAPSTTS